MEFLRKNRMMITFVGVVLLIVLRMLVLLLGIDPVNGYSNSTFWSICQIAIPIVLAIMLVLPVLVGGVKFSLPGESRGFHVGAGVAAVVFFGYTIVLLVQLWEQFSSAMLMYRLLIPWAAILKVVLSILAVGFFYMLARYGNALPSTAGLIMILGPIGLYMFRLIDNFLAITINPSVDTYALWVISGGITLFFLAQMGRAWLDGAVKPMFAIASSLAALTLALSSVATLILSLLQAPVYAGLVGWADLACDIAMLLVAVFAVRLDKTNSVSCPRQTIKRAATSTPHRRIRYIPKH